ncbi:hypothetical protein NC653_040534 [Populus alba x Populus x berolinensis]|uniref:Uncharacterized protein n=1 Tax=Populus alba x Populus x berolinensis TaxID=444605 RepID=A0AAD6L6D9_9ROSI|nr:hypothetical protein NC653_040534 [Populus alba x Populus x berolinensis]
MTRNRVDAESTAAANTAADNFLADEHNLQEEKRKMVASAFGKDQSGGSATCLTVEDLKYLYMV